MSTTAFALLGFVIWTMLLLGSIGVLRSVLTLSGARAANSFSPTGSDVSPFAERLSRAHANCYESFPIFGGLLLLALATGSTQVTDPLALWALAARIGQSCVHLISTAAPAVLLRFGFFLAQFGIMLYWAVGLWSVVAVG